MDYVAVKIPLQLAQKVDEVIKELGYEHSRTEFVATAANHLAQLAEQVGSVSVATTIDRQLMCVLLCVERFKDTPPPRNPEAFWSCLEKCGKKRPIHFIDR